MKQTLSNTEILLFVIGWQGGTVHQLARELMVTGDTILNADREAMEHLCRVAQRIRNERKAA